MQPPPDNDQLHRIRHSLAHVLAQAVLELRPGSTLGFGPPIADGFYYDFILSAPITEDDFPALEKKMKHIIAAGQKFEREDLPGPEADRPLDIAGIQRATLAQPVVERAQGLGGAGAGFGLAHDQQVVAAADHLHPEFLLQPRQVAVMRPAQVDQQAVVGEIERGLQRVAGRGRGGQGAQAQARLLGGRSRSGPMLPTRCPPVQQPGADFIGS